MKPELVLPPLRRTTADAELFARTAHAGQVDKSGAIYADHLERVAARTMEKVAGLPGILSVEMVSEVLQIAWLHDVIEDTSYPSANLAAEGFSQSVVMGVCHLTKDHRGRGSYAEWIRALCLIAPLSVLLVKLSDNEDNADPERLARLDEATRVRLLAKYDPSMAMLREAAQAKGWRG